MDEKEIQQTLTGHEWVFIYSAVRAFITALLHEGTPISPEWYEVDKKLCQLINDNLTQHGCPVVRPMKGNP